MKKILYLHGLESSPGGEKVEFLSQKSIVHAPAIDYKDPKIFDHFFSIMVNVQPDVIIGSSMGGYLGYILGNLFSKQTILFNPALHSRTFEPSIPLFDFKKHPIEPIIVLGEEDEIIDFKTTIKHLNDKSLGAIIETYKGGHRVSLNVFTDIYNKYYG